jgi:hypothetical protein
MAQPSPLAFPDLQIYPWLFHALPQLADLQIYPWLFRALPQLADLQIYPWLFRALPQLVICYLVRPENS